MPDGSTKVKLGSMDDLASMTPETVTMQLRLHPTVRGAEKEKREAIVTELPIIALGQIGKLFAPILKAAPKNATMMDLATEALGHPEEMVRAVALGLEWPIEDAGRIVGSDFTKALIAILQVNANFLRPILGPVAFAVLAMVQASNGDGSALSPSSAFTEQSPNPSDSPSEGSKPQ